MSAKHSFVRRLREPRRCPTMANYVNFHSQLASIMEVLANAAVAEICQLVDDGFATLRLEISRTQRENLALRSKLRLMEVRSGGRSPRRAPVPPLVVTCTRKDHHMGEELSTSAKGNGKSTVLGNADSQFSRLVVVAEPPVEPEMVVVKEERLEDELTDCSILEDCQMAPSSSIGLQSHSVAAEKDHHLNVDVSLNMKEAEIPRISLSGQYEAEDLAQVEAQQQDKEEEEEEGEADSLKIQQPDSRYNTYDKYHPSDMNHGLVTRSPGPNETKEIAELSSHTEENKDVGDVNPCGSLSVAESSSSKGLDAEAAFIKTLDADMSLANVGMNGLCGTVPSVVADWKREAAETGSAPVKMETEMQPSWTEGAAFGTNLPLLTISRKDKEELQINNSKLITSTNNCITDNSNLSSQSHHREGESAETKPSELDSGGFDSPSFNDLFSSPEVARSLIAPHKDSTDSVGGIEERLPSSSFPFLTSRTRSANPTCPTSDSPADSSLRSPSSDSRSRGFLSNPERVFSCQQCGRLFSNSRDLVVHQRSHAGERLFHCPLCKKPFLHLHQLKTHQRVHTGEKPFSCTQCGKRFSQSSHIKRHMSVHTGEKRYSCGLCGKRFSQACSLKVHQAVHTGERPYSCTQCGKCFSVLGNLVRHQSVHIGK